MIRSFKFSFFSIKSLIMDHLFYLSYPPCYLFILYIDMYESKSIYIDIKLVEFYIFS